jgi:uncharacterized lipoprotein YajG
MPLEAMTEAIHQANLRKQIDGKVVSAPMARSEAGRLAASRQACRHPMLGFTDPDNSSQD